MRRHRVGADDANRMPGSELRRQLVPPLVVRKCPQFGVDIRLENEDAHGRSFCGHRPAEVHENGAVSSGTKMRWWKQLHHNLLLDRPCTTPPQDRSVVESESCRLVSDCHATLKLVAMDDEKLV
jgi:hypothetical protein